MHIVWLWTNIAKQRKYYFSPFQLHHRSLLPSDARCTVANVNSPFPHLMLGRIVGIAWERCQSTQKNTMDLENFAVHLPLVFVFLSIQNICSKSCPSVLFDKLLLLMTRTVALHVRNFRVLTRMSRVAFQRRLAEQLHGLWMFWFRITDGSFDYTIVMCYSYYYSPVFLPNQTALLFATGAGNIF